MRKLAILSALVAVLFTWSCTKEDSSSVGPSADPSQASLKNGNGNNNCTPERINYDETYDIPGPFPWIYTLDCIDEQVQAQHIWFRVKGKGNIAASCHVNDHGSWEETSTFIGVTSGDTYTLHYETDYHYNYNSWWNGAFWEEQGAVVARSNAIGYITNNTTNETVIVNVDSRFVMAANGNVSVSSYDVTCE